LLTQIDPAQVLTLIQQAFGPGPEMADSGQDAA
jgi:hypothetical protein